MRFNLPFPKDKPFDVVGMELNSFDFLTLVPEFPTLNSKMKILRFSKQGGGKVPSALQEGRENSLRRFSQMPKPGSTKKKRLSLFSI